jgi:hypothetical protein
MKSIKFVTGLVRLSYANIWTPKEDLSKRMRYSASLLIKKSDTKTVSRLKSKIKDLINDEEAKKILGTKGKDLDLPLRDGDKEKEGDPNYAGHYFLNAKASEEYPPKILDSDGEMLMGSYRNKRFRIFYVGLSVKLSESGVGYKHGYTRYSRHPGAHFLLCAREKFVQLLRRNLSKAGSGSEFSRN